MIRKIFIVSVLLLTVSQAFSQNNWPSYAGPLHRYSQLAPAGTQMATSSNEIRYVFTTEEIVPGAASQSPRYGGSGHASNIPYPSGGGYSPIVVDGKLFQNYFRPTGKVYDIGEYSSRVTPTGNDWYPELWLLDADEIFLCIDAATGKTKWRTVVPKAGFNHLDHKGVIANASPCYHNGRVYFLSSMMEVFCLDTAAGQVLWRRTLPSTTTIATWKANSLRTKTYRGGANRHFNQSLTVVGDILIVPEIAPTGQAIRVRGYDPVSGDLFWTSPSAVLGSLATAPAVWKNGAGQEFLVVANDGGTMSMINPVSGALMWQQTGLGNNEYSIICVNNTAIVRMPDFSHAGFLLSETGATQIWSLPAGSVRNPIPGKVGMVGFPNENKAYVRADGTLQQVVIVDVNTGRAVNSTGTSPTLEAADYMLGDMIIQEEDSQHNRLSASLFKSDSASFPGRFGWGPLHKASTSYAVPTQPALANGNMYVRGSGGIHVYNLVKTPSNFTLTFQGFQARNVFRNPGDSLRITVNATGSPDLVRLFLNGIQVAQAQTTNQVSYLIPSIPAGSHLLEARSEKAATNERFSAYLHINARNIGSVSLMPDSASIQVGQSQFYAAIPFFDNGMQWYREYIEKTSPIPQPTYNFSVSGNGGTFTNQGYFTATKAGQHWVKVSATRNGITAVDSVLILVQRAMQSLIFSPLPDLLETDYGHKLVAVVNTGRDASFEIISGPGQVIGDSLKPTGPGTIILKVWEPGDENYSPSNIVFDTIQVLEAGVPTRLRLTPKRDTLPAYGARLLTVQLLNDQNFPIPFAETVNFEILDRGSISSFGVYTADTILGWNKVKASITISATTFSDTAWFWVEPVKDIISINFCTNANSLTQADFAGIMNVRWWHNSSFGMGGGMRTSQGVPLLETTLQWTGLGNNYVTADPAASPNQILMRQFVGQFAVTNPINIRLYRLPSNFAQFGYDAFVLWGNHENNNKTIRVKLNDLPEKFIRDNDNTWKGTFSESTALQVGDALPGHEYVAFRNVADTTFNLTVRPANNVQRFGISGLQLSARSASWGKKEQIIVLPAIGSQPSNRSTPIPLGGLSSSGLALTYTVVSGPASVSGNQLTLTGAPGLVTVRANQAGNIQYQSALPVETSFLVYLVVGNATDLNLPQVTWYPNPGQPFVEISGGEKARLQIFHADGREVLSTTLQGKTTRVNTTELASGVYRLSFTFPDGRRTNGRWVKK